MKKIFLVILIFMFGCELNNKVNYKLTYDANGATSGDVPVAKEYEQNSSVTIEGNTGSLKRIPPAGTAEAFKFGGWNTKPDGTGVDYIPGTNITLTGSLTLYAKWVPFQVGDIGPAGGYVLYDKGSFSYSEFTNSDESNFSIGYWRYIEVAPPETIESLPFGAYGTDIIPPDPKDLNINYSYGKPYTEIAAQWLKQNNGTNTAAVYCYDFVYNGYDDWFMADTRILVHLFTDTTFNTINTNYNSYIEQRFWCPFDYTDTAVSFKIEYDGFCSFMAVSKNISFFVLPARYF